MFGRKKIETPDAEGAEKKKSKTTLRQGEASYHLQGTFAYADSIKKVKRRHRNGSAIGVLVPVTEGKYAGAVGVHVDNMRIGSMPSSTSEEFTAVIAELNAKRKRATVMLDLSNNSLGEDEVWVTADAVIAD